MCIFLTNLHKYVVALRRRRRHRKFIFKDYDLTYFHLLSNNNKRKYKFISNFNIVHTYTYIVTYHQNRMRKTEKYFILYFFLYSFLFLSLCIYSEIWSNLNNSLPVASVLTDIATPNYCRASIHFAWSHAWKD